MSIRDLEVAKVLLSIKPDLVRSEEAVTELVMRDIIDFNTGMKLTEKIRSRSTETEDVPEGETDDEKMARLRAMKKDSDSGDSETGKKCGSKKVSSESEEIKKEYDEKVGTADTDQDAPVSSIQFPNVNQEVVIRAVLELSSADEKEDFDRLLDKLNTNFQSAYKRRRADIIRVVSKVVEINNSDVDLSKKIMDELKNEQMIFIKK